MTHSTLQCANLAVIPAYFGILQTHYLLYLNGLSDFRTSVVYKMTSTAPFSLWRRRSVTSWLHASNTCFCNVSDISFWYSTGQITRPASMTINSCEKGFFHQISITSSGWLLRAMLSRFELLKNREKSKNPPWGTSIVDFYQRRPWRRPTCNNTPAHSKRYAPGDAVPQLAVSFRVTKSGFMSC